MEPTAQPDRHGLFLLSPKRFDLYKPADFDVDIVAIHGLGGHPYKTWTDSDGHLWLRDSLPERIPKVRVMTFGYDSAFLFSNNRSSIYDYAADLMTRLEIARDNAAERRRPLIFVCHSLGGVVFKELLVYLSLQLGRHQDLLDSIFGVVFMGTPHRGSRSATPGRMLSKIINIATLGTAIRTDLIRTLEASSNELETISRHSTELLKSLSIVSFYEQKPIGPVMIVEPFSAILGVPNERAIPINADHKALACVSPRKEQRYLPVWTSIRELVEASSTTRVEVNRKLLDHLYCVNYKAGQHRPQQAYQGTCDWIFTHPTFVSWLHSKKSSMLLLTGQAGMGKSVLTRHLTESILSGGGQEDIIGEDGYLGISFFCSYTEAALNNEAAILRSLLHQLIQLNGRCAAIVQNRLERRTRAGLVLSLQVEDLWNSLIDVLSMSTMQRLFIAVDAIEELGVNVAVSMLLGLLNLVDALNLRRPESRLRIVVSSRYNNAYAALPNLVTMKIDKGVVQEDIKTFLRGVVDDFENHNSGFKSALDANAEARDKIINRVADRADGMFLQAALMWDIFQRGMLWNEDVIDTKLKKLDDLPRGTTALYDRIINGIGESLRDDAFSIFSILAGAAEPLSEVEMGVILGIANSTRPIVYSTDIRTFKDLYQTMNESFPDLITIQDDGRVTFVHISFKEYLQDKNHHSDTEADLLLEGRRKITRACLQYLKLRDLLQDAHDGMGKRDLHSQYPFLSYAQNHFQYHICRLPYDDDLWILFSKTVGKYNIYNIESLQPEERYMCFSPLTAVLDEVPPPDKYKLIRKFKENGYDLDERWSVGRKGWPLQYSCSRATAYGELKDAAFLLLELGANPNLPLRPTASNLQRAIESRAWDLYEKLLNSPMTDPDAVNSQGYGLLHTLISLAEVVPLSRITQLLDDFPDIDVNLQDLLGFTPLHLATSLNRINVVRKLLDFPGIRLDVTDNQGRTALTIATYWGAKAMAMVLIEHSQAFPVPASDQLSPLVFSAAHQQKELCSKLLERSGYRNLGFHIDLAGRCILHHAAINNWTDILESCIRQGRNPQSGVNINQIDHSGRTALHHAAALGNVESCAVLVADDAGASLNLQDRNGRTAVHAAADAGFKDVLLVLFKTGRVDPNQCDVEGRNLVHWMATLDCVDLMHILASFPMDVEWAKHDKHGKRPVDIAGQCQCRDVGLFLAERTPGRVEWSFQDMYDSRTVNENYDDAGLRRRERDAMEQYRARQYEIACEERAEIRRRYPEKHWAVIHPGDVEEINRKEVEAKEAQREYEKQGPRPRYRREDMEVDDWSGSDSDLGSYRDLRI